MKRLLLAGSLLVLVLTACGGAQRVPKGVSEIDVRAPVGRPTRGASPAHIFSRRITDPAQVKSIVGWFDSLERPRKTNVGCAGGFALDVTFTFRSPNGEELASANGPPATAGTCDPIHFTVRGRGRQETFLVDGNPGSALIGRVKRLLGPRFQPAVGVLG